MSRHTASHAINEYRIEKLRCPVTVLMTGGERIAGDVFVSATGPHRSGPEQAIDVLNAPEPFVPIATADDEILILAKHRIAEVEIESPEPEPDPEMAGLKPVAIEVTMVGGSLRIGFLHLAVRSDRPRLLDYLNGLTEQFQALFAIDGVRLVNRALIERVRPVD